MIFRNHISTWLASDWPNKKDSLSHFLFGDHI